MKPSNGQLIALKAILVGHAAALNPMRKRVAESMVDAAIDQLSGVESKAQQLQLAFYCLVRAELRRIGGEPLSDRATARSISESLRSDLFKHFMEYERETERLLGRQSPTLTDPSPPEPQLSPWTATVSDWSLNEKQEFFIHKATLSEILAAHGIVWTA